MHLYLPHFSFWVRQREKLILDTILHVCFGECSVFKLNPKPDTDDARNYNLHLTGDSELGLKLVLNICCAV